MLSADSIDILKRLLENASEYRQKLTLVDGNLIAQNMPVKYLLEFFNHLTEFLGKVVNSDYTISAIANIQGDYDFTTNLKRYSDVVVTPENLDGILGMGHNYCADMIKLPFKFKLCMEGIWKRELRFKYLTFHYTICPVQMKRELPPWGTIEELTTKAKRRHIELGNFGGLLFFCLGSVLCGDSPEMVQEVAAVFYVFLDGTRMLRVHRDHNKIVVLKPAQTWIIRSTVFPENPKNVTFDVLNEVHSFAFRVLNTKEGTILDKPVGKVPTDFRVFKPVSLAPPGGNVMNIDWLSVNPNGVA